MDQSGRMKREGLGGRCCEGSQGKLHEAAAKMLAGRRLQLPAKSPLWVLLLLRLAFMTYGQRATSLTLAAGRTKCSLQVANATRHFIVHTPSLEISAVVLLLHPSSTFSHSSFTALTPAKVFEAEMPARFSQWAGAVLVFLSSRHLANGLHCWGVGTDNGLCTAPTEGAEDESFVLNVLDWLAQFGGGGGGSLSTAPTLMFGYSGGKNGLAYSVQLYSCPSLRRHCRCVLSSRCRAARWRRSRSRSWQGSAAL